jgi:uncharacterized membrane protein
MAKKEAKKTESVNNGKACAALSYILIGIIWYFFDEKMKQNSFVKFHVKQGLVLLIAWIIYSIVLSIIFSALFVPLMFGGMMFGLIGILRLLNLVPWVFAIIGIINAVGGNQKELPIIGKYASKFTF